MDALAEIERHVGLGTQEAITKYNDLGLSQDFSPMNTKEPMPTV